MQVDINAGYWPLVALLAGPIGGLVGALLVTVANALLATRNEQLKWAREDRLHLRQTRLEIYADLLTKVETMISESMKAHRRALRLGEDLKKPPEELWAIFLEARDAYNKLLIFASPDVSEVANEYWQVVTDIAWWRGWEKEWHKEWDGTSTDPVVKAIDDAGEKSVSTRRRLIEAIKREQGL